MESRLEGGATQDRAGEVFAALADPTRRRILRELSAQGPLSPTALGARVGVTRQAAAQHLEALSGAGLVRGERAGREMRYRLDTAPFAAVEGWMRSIGASWARRLAVLERLAEDPAGGSSQS